MGLLLLPYEPDHCISHVLAASAVNALSLCQVGQAGGG